MDYIGKRVLVNLYNRERKATVISDTYGDGSVCAIVIDKIDSLDLIEELGMLTINYNSQWDWDKTFKKYVGLVFHYTSADCFIEIWGKD